MYVLESLDSFDMAPVQWVRGTPLHAHTRTLTPSTLPNVQRAASIELQAGSLHFSRFPPKIRVHGQNQPAVAHSAEYKDTHPAIPAAIVCGLRMRLRLGCMVLGDGAGDGAAGRVPQEARGPAQLGGGHAHGRAPTSPPPTTTTTHTPQRALARKVAYNSFGVRLRGSCIPTSVQGFSCPSQVLGMSGPAGPAPSLRGSLARQVGRAYPREPRRINYSCN